MASLSVRIHPDILFSYSSHHTELILRVENNDEHSVWAEADIHVPERLSLSPTNTLQKGRVRIGIIGTKEFLEKSVRIYSSTLTSPQIYKCNVVLYVFNKDGVIETRLEKAFNLRCEPKKEATM